MVAGRFTSYPPDLVEPFIIGLLRDDAQASLFRCRFPVAARFTLHQYVFDVVLYDGIGFVGFPKELRTVLDLVIRVCDLVPDDRRKVVETDVTALDADVRMQRHDEVPAVFFPG